MPTDQTSGSDPTNTGATSISNWKKEPAPETQQAQEGFLVDLPTGNRVFMKRDLAMSTMLATGKIPNPLAGIVQSMIDGGMREIKPRDIEKHMSDPRVSLQLLDLTHECVVNCVMEPQFDMPAARNKLMGSDGKRVSESPEQYMDRLAVWKPDLSDLGKLQHAASDHDEDDCDCERKISVWDMDMNDRFFIFSVAQGAAADLASFREEQERFVADVPAGQGVRKPTKRTGGNRSKK